MLVSGFVLFIFSVIFLSISLVDRPLSDSTAEIVEIGDQQNHNLINLNTNGFSLQSQVVVTLLALADLDSNTEGTVYVAPCNQLQTMSVHLPPKETRRLRYILNRSNYERRANNYFDGMRINTPINLLPGSILIYNVTTTLMEQGNGCLRLYLFDSYTHYRLYIDRGIDDSYVNRSDCIPVSDDGTPLTTPIVFNTISKQADYYVALGIEDSEDSNSTNSSTILV